MKITLFLSLLFVICCQQANTKAVYHFKSSDEKTVAAKFGKISITKEELFNGIRSDIYEQEKKIFDIKFNRLKQLILEKLIAQDPSSKGQASEAYLEKKFASRLKISKKEIDQFIKDKKIPANHLNDQLKDRIKTFLKNEKLKGLVDTFIGEKTGKSGVEVYFQKPSRPTFNVSVGDAPLYGDKSAKVSIVEFSDFQCPFCSKALPILSELKKKYGNKINVAFKHFPLPFHKQAEKASVASMCAHEQGNDKFWKYHDHLFQHQNELAPEQLKAAAKKLGLDTAKFDDCLDNNKYLAFVRKNIEEGEKIGVRSTPTFYVNGKLVNGAQPVEVFSEIIDDELKAK
jgi:protein-disulfide isomerase